MTQQEKIYVHFDGVTREATPEEDARIRARWAEEEKQIAAEKAEKAAKASAKAALLDRLGITEDEARLLLS